MKYYTLAILVENEAGVLSQVIRLFSRKGYNIESIAEGVTNDPKVARITIIIKGDDLTANRIVGQLNKLMCVISVKIMDKSASVSREFVMVKVKTATKEARDEVVQIAGIFRASIIDVNLECVIITLTGDESKIEAFLNLLSEFGILEIARTGVISLDRGLVTINGKAEA